MGLFGKTVTFPVIALMVSWALFFFPGIPGDSTGAAFARSRTRLKSAPYVQSKLHLRVTNRKYVGHILYQLRGTKHYVVLITNHGPHHWAFHGRPHPLYHRCAGPAACMNLMVRLDKHLKSGRNLGLSLRGSYIAAFVFYGEGRSAAVSK